jgi:AcrR family transcriptional regulator
MADVAEASGTARQTLYRFFSGREELVEAALVARIGELAEGLTATRDAERTFERALVETSIATIETARGDTELQALLVAAPSVRLHHVLAGPYPPVASLVRRFWQPWFDKARRTGHLRTDVSEDELVEWIRGVYLMLILRDDLRGELERERLMLRRFLLPAIVPAR